MIQVFTLNYISTSLWLASNNILLPHIYDYPIVFARVQLTTLTCRDLYMFIVTPIGLVNQIQGHGNCYCRANMISLSPSWVPLDTHGEISVRPAYYPR